MRLFDSIDAYACLNLIEYAVLRNNVNIIAMSIYSGFATRFQEEAYDNCIDSLLYILQKRIIKFYQGQTADEQKFVSLIIKLHQQMRNMEKNKYLEPKSSNSVNELIKFLGSSQRHTVPNRNSNGKSKQSEPAEVLQPKPSLPDITNEKKKSTFWVERKPAEGESSKTQTEQEVQTMGTINKKANGAISTEDKMQFRRTTYQPRHIRAFNVKNASRSKLSGEKREERYLGVEDKELKKRSMSNNIHPKPAAHFKETQEEGQDSSRVHNRRNRSISRVNQADTASGTGGQVADIIKDYIVKVKRSYLRGHRNREIKESMGRMPDF